MISNKLTVNSSTFIEQLDPRVKFISLMLLGAQAFVFEAAFSLIPPTVLVIAVVVISRIPFSLIMKRLPSISVFILFAICANMVTISGQILFEFMGVYATREGLYQGVLLSARIVLLLVAATIFVRTTTIISMIDGIEATFRPVNKRFGALIQVLTISLNFVPLLIQSAKQIKNAQIVRGANPDKNIVRQLQFAMSATVPLFATTLRSSEHLALAMESRCYNPQSERTYYQQLQMNRRDWTALSIIAIQFSLSIAVAI